MNVKFTRSSFVDAPQVQFFMSGMELPDIENLREGKFVINSKVGAPFSLSHVPLGSDRLVVKQSE